MRRTKRRGNALFRKVKQLYSTIVRKKIKGYSKNHKIFSKNEASQGLFGLGRGKNAIDSARAAGANAATRRAKKGKPRKSAPASKPGRPKAASCSLRPRRRGKRGHTPGEKRQAPKKRPGAKDRPPGSCPPICYARAAGENAATRRAKSGRKVTSSEKAPRR